ncbi:MAG: MotA/TolQ/ExbB proton channel family protein [Pseudomonadota bacterium]
MKFKDAFYIFLLMTFIFTSFIFNPLSAGAEDNKSEITAPGIEAIGDLLAPIGNVDNKSSKETNKAKPDSPAKNYNTTRNNIHVTVMSLLDIIKKGGIVGYLIILLSVLSLGLIIDYLFTIRKSKILPLGDIKAFDKIISDRNFDEVKKFDKQSASFFAKITVAGLKESDMGYQSMIKAMEDMGESLTSAIARKIEHLNVIGNISPMMGLLGTVIGMLRCFNEIAHVAGAIEPKQLAGGIFEALITTCMGLIVAIPSLYGYAVFKNRIDEYTGEAALTAEQMVSSFKTNQPKE